jgi:hypothetical protein
MTRWQHLFIHEHINKRNLFEMVQWCQRRHGDPTILPGWIESRLQDSGQAISWDETLGGWTRDWRNSGYSFHHSNPNFWPRIRQVPHIFPRNYLEFCPLHVLFYSQEDLSEFKLVWG